MLENLIFDRTSTDVALGTKKGYYNFDDLNRVVEAVDYVVSRFESLGYQFPEYTKGIVWSMQDIPTASQMEQYRRNVEIIRNRLSISKDVPTAPKSMTGLSFQGANNIEEILYLLEKILDAMEKAFLTRQAATPFMIAGGVFNNA